MSRKTIFWSALAGVIIGFFFTIPWTGVPIAIIGIVLWILAMIFFQTSIYFLAWMAGYYLVLFFIIGLIFYFYNPERYSSRRIVDDGTRVTHIMSKESESN